jgi:hypothetical protein
MRKGKIVFLLVIYFALPLAAAAAVLLTDPSICIDPLLCASYFTGGIGITPFLSMHRGLGREHDER